jgi:hypothetical protein
LLWQVSYVLRAKDCIKTIYLDFERFWIGFGWKVMLLVVLSSRAQKDGDR